MGNGPGSDVHLTPPEIWARLARVAGEGHLFDPCPHPWVIDGVAGVDGLGEDWPWQPGQVDYTNPPFSALLDWTVQAIDHARMGRTGVVLVPVRSSQPYWARLVGYADTVAYWRGTTDANTVDPATGTVLARRVRFMDANGERQSGAPFDTALFLLTEDQIHRERFCEAFGDVATISRLR
jgi:hypothetical protein